jgi:hypothetical protein
MKFSVQYIPLSKIKSDGPAALTQRIKKLRSLIWDCMNLLAVRKNRKDGSYTLLTGHERYVYLRDHTRKQAVPCIVDETPIVSDIDAYITCLLHRKETMLGQSKVLSLSLLPASWLIIRAFLKQEPRFTQLPRRQQLKVIVLAVQSRRTVITAMRAKVTELLAEKSL